MIPSRVLPHIHFDKFYSCFGRTEPLDLDVEIMLKASICNLSPATQAGIFSHENTENLNRCTMDHDTRNNKANDETTNLEINTMQKSWLNELAAKLNYDTEATKSEHQTLRKCTTEVEVDKDTNPEEEHPKMLKTSPTKYFVVNKSNTSSSNSDWEHKSKEPTNMDRSEAGEPEGFKLLTPDEKRRIFNNRRDDLFYKTFGRDVRKFLQDDFTDFTGYQKEAKGKDGAYFYKCLKEYAKHMRFSKGTSFTTEQIVCYLGSLINHREFKKACPKQFLQLSYKVYNTFNLFTKEKLYSLWQSDEFRVLFKYYVKSVNEDNNYSRLREHKTIGLNLAPYLFIYHEFCRVCL